MWGHLKAEDFMNLIEGASPSELSDKRLRHLESCARCTETLRAVEAVRNQVTAMQMTAEEDLPEPDWAEFRGDVRNTLLSRSVKRDSTNRNWLGGMAWKPAAAWGLSLLFVVGLTTGVVVWSPDGSETRINQVIPIDESVETAGTINAIAGMRQTDVFDDLLQLDEHETESLKLLLQDLTRDSVKPR